MQRVEDWARRQGRREVTPELLAEVRSAMPIDFSKKRPFFVADREWTDSALLLLQAAADSTRAYGEFPVIGARGYVWITAEVHLMFAAFVLGVADVRRGHRGDRHFRRGRAL